MKKNEIEKLNVYKTKEWIAYYQHKIIRHRNFLDEHTVTRKLLKEHLRKLREDNVEAWVT